jgi:hypothetical protein
VQQTDPIDYSSVHKLSQEYARNQIEQHKISVKIINKFVSRGLVRISMVAREQT